MRRATATQLSATGVLAELPADEQWLLPWIAKFFQPQNRKENITMTDQYILIIFVALAAALIVKVLRVRYRHEFIVTDGFAGLVYHAGKLEETLTAGRHVRWGKHYELTKVDVRKSLLHVVGQGVLSADNVAVKLSIVLTTQVVDAAKTVQVVDSWTAHIYSATQIAVRAVVAGATLEALLTQRITIGAQLRDLIAAQATAVGVELHAADVRDVMLPGELRKAFSDVLKAKHEGQAALEHARGESAALRNLANAARLVEDHPAVATLRFLQTLASRAGANQMLVMNDMTAFAPVKKAHNK
jgi:regulator of protease activity HflC (stomatin/prohibitin superfamily)